MRKLLVPILACLALPGVAEAKPFLSKSRAEAAITAAERHWFNAPGAEVKIYPCTRRASDSIKCAVEMLDPMRWGAIQLSNSATVVLAHQKSKVYLG